MRERDQSEIDTQLRRELGAHLVAADWTVRGRESCEPAAPFAGGVLSVFVRPLREGFVGMVIFTWLREDDSPTLDVVGHVGVEYQPAQELLAALAGTEMAPAALKDPTVAVRVASVSEVSKGAEELSRFVSEQAPALDQLADVDIVVDLLRQHSVVPFEASTAAIYAMSALDSQPGASESVDTEDAERQLIPALLASAGRYEEARRALAEYGHLGSEQARSPREYRRFVRQLTRLLDMGSGFSLPTSPPRWPACPAQPQPPQSFRQVFSEQRPEARVRQEAVNTVRAISKGKTRAELRTLLARELDQREARMDTGSFDVTLDFLVTEQERFGRARLALRAVRALWELGSSSRKQLEVVSERPSNDVDAGPESESLLLKPPDRAAYPIWSIGDRSVAVELDATARSQLDSVMQIGASDVEDARFVDVWFAWDGESPVIGSHVNVYIGRQRVGQLDVDASEHFRPAMEAAADRDEDPLMTAHLKKSSGEMPYVLEIALPEPSQKLASD